MIWVFHKDPKKSAEQYPDQLLEQGVKVGIEALLGRKKWGKWAFKRSQNWWWMYWHVDELVHQVIERKLKLPWGIKYARIMDAIYQQPPNIPCHPRGLRSKFLSYEPRHIRPTPHFKIRLRGYKRAINTQDYYTWTFPSQEPFWYIGNVG